MAGNPAPNSPAKRIDYPASGRVISENINEYPDVSGGVINIDDEALDDDIIIVQKIDFVAPNFGPSAQSLDKLGGA